VATSTKYAHGVFSWVHLGTPDPTGAKRFYGNLFGWQFEDMPAGPEMTYTFVKLKNQSVGGLYALSRDMLAQGVPAHWLPFVNVTDVDGIAKNTSQGGGKVLYPPMDVLDVGRMAVLQDPTGAQVAIWQAKTHLGADLINETGAMCWNELMTPDVQAAGRFYGATFGWTAELVDTSADSSYTIFKAGTTQVGGMMARPPQMKDVPPNWLTYFGVTDCDGTAKKVGELGGKILKPPMDIPNIGRFAVCQDGPGAVFAIFTPQNA
jgi:predicted enzyme related to lactoylglutathione lyase